MNATAPRGNGGLARTPAIVPALALAMLALELATSSRYPMFRDEFYYVACGRHLAWGYVDHPPMIALLARLSVAWGGGTLFGIRLLPAVAGAVTVWLAGDLARRLGGRGWACAIACLGVMLGPVYLENFRLLTMNAFEILAWTLVLWCAVRLLPYARERAAAPLGPWLLLGAIAGLGLENKHSMAFLLVGLAIGLVLTPARALLRTRGPWLAALVALLLAAPNLAWEIAHHWPTLEFLRNAAARKNAVLPPATFMWGQAQMLEPLAAPVWIAGVLWLLFARPAAAWRALGVAWLAILALFLATHAKIYYLAPYYPLLFAAGGVAFERGTRALPALRPAYATVLVLAGALIAPVVMPLLPPARLERYLHALHLHPVATERHREPRLTQTIADQFGWQEMVAKVARVYHALPPEDQRRVVLYAHNYGEAGALDWYGPRYGLPRAYSGHNSYWWWGPPPPDRGAVALTVGEDPEDVAKTYAQVSVVDSTDCTWCMPFENHAPITVARQPKNTFAEIWSRCRMYI